jgi:hypothetical protein
MNAIPGSPRWALRRGQRTPWWAWLLGVSFLIAFAFNVIYTSLMTFGPAGGVTSDAPKGGALVEKVVPGTPLEKAGVRADDIVVAVNGQTIRNDHDLGEMEWQFEPGKPFLLTVERHAQRMQLTMLFSERRVWQVRKGGQWLDYSLDMALAVLYFAMGFVILLARPREPGTLAAAFLLLMFSASGLLGPGGGGPGTAVLFRHLPFLLQVPVFILTSLFGGYLILLFAALWPRPVFRLRWVLPVLLIPGLLMIANNVVRLYHRFYMPTRAISPGPPSAYRLQIAVEMANILVGLIVLALGYRRLKDAHERQRLRRVSFAALFSFGAFMVLLWLFSSESSSPLFRRIFQSEASGFVFLILQSIFPVVLALTVLRTGPASGDPS